MWPFTSDAKTAASVSEPSVPDACPVDHTQRSAFLADQSHPFRTASRSQQPRHAASLPTDREVSSIPRWRDESDSSQLKAGATRDEQGNWVYPSQKQFHAALERKGHTVHRVEDMDTIVPIHNAVNERTWSEVLDWERRATEQSGSGMDKVEGVKLVSFKGRPKELSPRARFRTLIGCVGGY